MDNPSTLSINQQHAIVRSLISFLSFVSTNEQLRASLISTLSDMLTVAEPTIRTIVNRALLERDPKLVQEHIITDLSLASSIIATTSVEDEQIPVIPKLRNLAVKLEDPEKTPKDTAQLEAEAESLISETETLAKARKPTRRKLTERSVQLREEFRRVPLQRKQASVTGISISLGLWLLALLYLFGFFPAFDFWPTEGSRDFFSIALITAGVIFFTGFTSRKHVCLNVRDMLVAIAGVEGVLLVSLWFLTGATLTSFVDMWFLMKWFLYLQAFLFLPWMLSFLIAHYFFQEPPRNTRSRHSA